MRRSIMFVCILPRLQIKMISLDRGRHYKRYHYYCVFFFNLFFSIVSVVATFAAQPAPTFAQQVWNKTVITKRRCCELLNFARVRAFPAAGETSLVSCYYTTTTAVTISSS